MDEYIRFKCLLEYFASHLEWVVNEDEKYIGFDRYIKPRIRNFSKAGQGYNENAIQNQIKDWDKYGDNRVCINVYAANYQSKGTYLNWKGTWKNIRPIWNNSHVAGFYLSKQEYAGAKKEYSASVDALGLFDGCKPNSALRNFFDRFYYMLKDIDDTVAGCIDLLKVNKNLVLTGAPGTGKTYLAEEIAKGMRARRERIQFHPSYDYTDFVEGLRPVMNDGQVGFRYEKGTFKLFCEAAIKEPDRDFVFIIDEINRGELAKIFGELFSAIDPGYRGTRGMVTTQYRNLIDDTDEFKDGFYVPDNVYIIGTMNDIDRGVESIDFAIRRRFAWKEITVDERKDMLDELGSRRAEAERRMDNLNRAIEENENLTADYKVGAAYFLKMKELDADQLWKLYLMPLLREYLRGTEEIDLQLEKFKTAYDGNIDS